MVYPTNQSLKNLGLKGYSKVNNNVNLIYILKIIKEIHKFNIFNFIKL